MKTIILVGNGAREHAIARAIKKSQVPNYLHCLASHLNPGIMRVADQLTIVDLLDTDKIMHASKKAAFVIIGPEAPLALGIVDVLKANNIPVIGPTKLLARIESSKNFCRNLLTEFKLPISPSYYFISTIEEFHSAVSALNFNFVIKADGLMGGKGVFVSGEHFDTLEKALQIGETLLSDQGGFLLEEKLIGEEFSLLSFSDGFTLKHMPLVQDHKRAYEGDKGPNTGGMGCYTFGNHSLPFLTQKAHQEAQQNNERVISALQTVCSEPYQGILYGGYMMTAKGIRVIEFNARFGDPEAINLLGLLETDFITLCEAMTTGTLGTIDIKFKHLASVCQYVVPNGYPDKPIKNQEIQFDPDNERLFCASVEKKGNQMMLLGSRAVACLALAESIGDAKAACDSLAGEINGPVFYRHDIASECLINQRISHINELTACPI